MGLLDYPLAFALRRGIDTAKLLSLLPAHLARHLSVKAKGISERVQQWIDPESFAKKQTEALDNAQKLHELRIRREDARHVASYIDLSSEVGKAWKSLNHKIDALGLDAVNYAHEDFDLISATKEWQLYTTALHARDAKAHYLMRSPDQFKIAFESSNIDLTNLQKQADNHEKRDSVAQYIQLLASKSEIIRDRIAYKIASNLKTHYAALKQASVNVKLLQAQASTHEFRIKLLSLDRDDRQKYKFVQRYIEITKTAAILWQEILTAKNVVKRHLISKLEKVTAERDELAYHLASYRNQYDAALDFFEIGLARAKFNFKPNEQSQKIAATKWYRLIANSARYEVQKHVEAYTESYTKNDVNARLILANEIMQDVRSHHAAIVKHKFDTKELWKNIRRDAKLYLYKVHYAELTEAQKKAFDIVKSYSMAASAHKQAWREIFESKKLQNVGENTLQKAIKSFVSRYTKQRNALAEQIDLDKQPFIDALNYFKVEPEAIQAHVQAHQILQIVHQFANEKDLLKKSELACRIKDNPKVYHGHLIEMQISWRTINKIATFSESRAEFASLSNAEKKVHRLIRKYTAVNRQIGKAYSSRHKNRSERQIINLKQQFACREYLAWQLANCISPSDPSQFNLLVSNYNLDRHKIADLASKYGKHITSVKNYQHLKSTLVAKLQKVKLDALSPDLLNNLYNDVVSVLSTLKYIHDYQGYSMRYSANMTGLNVKDILSHKLQIETIKNKLTLLAQKNKYAIKPPSQPIKSFHAKPIQRYDISKIRDELNERAEDVAQHYLGQPKAKISGTMRFGKNKGSLVVTCTGNRKGLWRDFQLDIGGDMLSLIQHVTNKSNFRDVLREAINFLGGESQYRSLLDRPRSRLLTEQMNIQEQDAKLAKVKAIVEHTIPVQGTMAEKYLREIRKIRSIKFDDEVIRFHPALRNWMTGDILPALIIVSRDKENHARGLQAIFLDPNTAKKANLGQYTKLSRGFISNGAVINKGDESKKKVAFAEGIETAFSIAEASPELKVYMTFGVSNFEKVALKETCKSILICADNDGINSGTTRMVEKVIKNLSDAGKNVWVAMPQKPESTLKWDFNDELQQNGVTNIKHALTQAVFSAVAKDETLLANEIINLSKTIDDHHMKISHDTKQAEPKKETSFLKLLEDYIEMELALKKHIDAYHTGLGNQNPDKANLKSKALEISKMIIEFAENAVKQPSFEANFTELSSVGRRIDIAKQGGFKAIAERSKQGQMSKADQYALMKQLKSKASQSEGKSQDLSRGRVH